MSTANTKTLDCEHCGAPQPWASHDATRVLCAGCAPRHRFTRLVTGDLFEDAPAEAQPEEVLA